MTVHKLIKLIITFCLLAILYSCANSPKLKYSLTKLNDSIKPIKISINKLAKQYKSYQGQYIETTGRFHQAFEEFAVYTDKNFITGESDGFWLDIYRPLNINYDSLETMNGDKITIKGMIDTTDKGHLGAYLATIRKIYYWERR